MLYLWYIMNYILKMNILYVFNDLYIAIAILIGNGALLIPPRRDISKRGASARSYFSPIEDHDICNHSVYSLIKPMITS
jgi:hypothetical protein